MDALPVLIKLIGWNLIWGHPLRIGMTFCTGRSNLRGIYRSFGITHGANVVDTVAACTGRNIFVSARVPHTMHTGLIFGELINPHLWIEAAHVIQVGMTPRTQGRDLTLLRLRIVAVAVPA